MRRHDSMRLTRVARVDAAQATSADRWHSAVADLVLVRDATPTEPHEAVITGFDPAMREHHRRATPRPWSSSLTATRRA
jgi:hypothetical protein